MTVVVADAIVKTERWHAPTTLEVTV